jgi:hypothetical protein
MEKIANLERKILTLSELHANSEDEVEKWELNKKINELHSKMSVDTRWFLRPISNTILEDQVIIKQQRFDFKIEDRTIKNITDGSDI